MIAEPKEVGWYWIRLADGGLEESFCALAGSVELPNRWIIPLRDEGVAWKQLAPSLLAIEPVKSPSWQGAGLEPR